MKRFVLLLLALAMIFTSVNWKAPVRAETAVTVSVEGAACPQTEFAAGDIITSLTEKGFAVAGEDADWQIVFAPVDDALGEQCYEISVNDRVITIAGGDANGLMYGGLEVAEQIDLYGIENVKASSGKPYVKQRGMLCPVPMDMRSPSYNSPGENAQKNIGSVWDIEFWHDYLDNLARNRMNVVQVWTVNSFASMVKVDGYEDIALQDVWRSTAPLDNSFRGDLSNAVRPQDWENHEVVVEMTIEEKIAFWQDVMRYAKDRGIGFLFLFRHLYTFAEEGKYGITHDPENPVLKDYLCRSMQTFIETYPDIIGVGLNPGENMGWDNTTEGVTGVMQWLHDIYVPGINAALEKTPRRKFQVMFQENNKQEYVDMYADMNCEMSFVRGYSSVHMYATSTPRNSDRYVANKPEGTGLWLNCRNEDNFDMRWGDPDFMVEFVNNIPADKILGLVTGSDGYFYGKDYSSTDPELQGQMYMRKHWYNYMLLGRLMYDNNMPRERIYDIFADHYDNMKGVETLYEATSIAGKIIPQVHKIYFQDNSDYTWFVGGSWSHPSTFGYLGVKRWMRSSNAFGDGSAMSIEEYCMRQTGAVENEPTEAMTPYEVAERLTDYGTRTLALVEEIRTTVPRSEEMSFAEREFWALVDDNEAMAYLGLYYAEKILGAVELRLFNDTKEDSWKESSVTHLEKSAEYFGEHARIISANYIPQYLARVGYYNVNDVLAEVEKDVDIARKWRPKTIQPSWNPPSKSTYFDSGDSNE